MARAGKAAAQETFETNLDLALAAGWAHIESFCYENFLKVHRGGREAMLVLAWGGERKSWRCTCQWGNLSSASPPSPHSPPPCPCSHAVQVPCPP